MLKPLPARCALLLTALTAVAAVCLAPYRVAAAAAPPVVTITIDDDVITRLLTLIQTHDDSAASVNAWIDLPGNSQLLAVGAGEHELTRAQLAANVKAVIDGAATNESQPKYSFGRVLMSPLSDYKNMIAELRQRAKGWLTASALRDAAYAPPGVNVRQTVYLHLGGDWDAINRGGAIFINMAFFHDYFTPSWFGLDLLIAHETFHAVQNQAFGNPESADSADAAFYTALSKIQREGTARLVELNADPGGYMPGTYGFYFRGVDEESLREFPQTIALLGALARTCYPSFDPDRYRQAYATGMNAGGPYYTVGEGIAAAIERYAGHARLVQTVARGPLDFFDVYAHLARVRRDLPPLPADALAQIERLRKANPSGRVPGVPDAPGLSSSPPAH